ERLAKRWTDKPLFVFVLTSTNHPPYDLPEDYTRVARDMSQWRGETSADTLVPNLDSYHYATDLLGEFVQHMQKVPTAARTLIAGTGDHNVRSFGIYAEPSRRYLVRQVPFVIWGTDLQCGSQLSLPASHRDIFSTLLPLAGIEGPYVNAGRNLLKAPGAQPDAMNVPRALFFTGEARNTSGMWQLGNKDSFVCSAPSGSALSATSPCQFNAVDDQQERARYALLDWHIRISLKK
ncbi:MAG: sulfatase-like hydrolase/transferase, partial [Rhodoferax sp.]|nr:sulfatase-like hydrolase/transferase [Rhodoferax sp.]